MKKIKITLAVLAVMCAANTFAQTKAAAKSNTLSIGVEGGLPIGDLGKVTSVGLGGSAKAGFGIFEGGAITLSAGYMSFFAKKEDGAESGPNLNLIPLKAGLRYGLGSSFYGEPQLGYTIASVSGGEGSSGAFTYAANVGYMASAVDVAIRYEAYSKAGFTNSFVGLRLAYSFGL